MHPLFRARQARLRAQDRKRETAEKAARVAERKRLEAEIEAARATAAAQREAAAAEEAEREAEIEAARATAAAQREAAAAEEAEREAERRRTEAAREAEQQRAKAAAHAAAQVEEEKRRARLQAEADRKAKRTVFELAWDASLEAYDAQFIGSLSGEQYEHWLAAAVFRRTGVVCRLTPRTGDNGADLLFELNGRKIVLQAKRWKNDVGVEAIGYTEGARSFYGCTEAWVVTTTGFTDPAIKFAERVGVRLCVGDPTMFLTERAKERTQ